MKHYTMIRQLKELSRHCEDNDFSTVSQDRALKQAIEVLEENRRLLRCVAELGQQDIYTDAPEYKNRVDAMRGLAIAAAATLIDAIIPKAHTEAIMESAREAQA